MAIVDIVCVDGTGKSDKPIVVGKRGIGGEVEGVVEEEDLLAESIEHGSMYL